MTHCTAPSFSTGMLMIFWMGWEWSAPFCRNRSKNEAWGVAAKALLRLPFPSRAVWATRDLWAERGTAPELRRLAGQRKEKLSWVGAKAKMATSWDLTPNA